MEVEMKSQYRQGIMGLMVLGLLFSSATVFAQQMKGVGKEGKVTEEMKEKFKQKMDQKFDEMAEKLDLTAEQKAKLLEGKEKNFKEMQADRKIIGEKRKELSRELEKAELNMDRIYQINSEIKELQAKKQDQLLQKILEVRQILTPIQFGKFTVLIEEGRKGMRDNFKKDKHGQGDRQGWGKDRPMHPEEDMDEGDFPPPPEME